ncbi:MAG: hypothetical protein Q4D39_02370 [Coriobacteriaceae bacterium]|nr:hypothetical protein [Coriobacteriaceae bacterium]
MKRIKQFLPFVFAGIIALFLVACGGSKAPEGGDTTAQPGFNFVQLDNVSGATITATGEAEATQIFDITLKDGEAFVCTGVTETGEWEIVISQNDSEIATDQLNQGTSVSETALEPGTYTVTVTAKAATGTVNVLAYPAGTLDFENTDTEALIALVQDYINANA